MMQPPLVFLALVYAVVRSVGAAPPTNPPTSLAVSVIEQSVLLTNRGDNTCGKVNNMSCDPNATGGGWCCSEFVSFTSSISCSNTDN